MAQLRAGSLVQLRAPWALRGTSAVIRRRTVRGFEVEIRTPLGTPMHLVVPRRHLRPVPNATDAGSAVRFHSREPQHP